MQWSVNKLTEKGFLRGISDKILSRLTYGTDLSAVVDADWIIEAVLEVEALKIDLFKALERKSLQQPAGHQHFLHTHYPYCRTLVDPSVCWILFFRTVPFMGLVEVVKGEQTAGHVFEAGVDFITSLGKTPVRVNRDIPGFVMNRIFSAAFRKPWVWYRTALSVRKTWMSVCDWGTVGMWAPLRSPTMPAWIPLPWWGNPWRIWEENLVTKSDLLLKMIAQGRLGKKTGKGFYRYTKDGKRLPYGRRNRDPDHNEGFNVLTI